MADAVVAFVAAAAALGGVVVTMPPSLAFVGRKQKCPGQACSATRMKVHYADREGRRIPLIHIPLGDPRWPQVNAQRTKEKGCKQGQDCLITLITLEVKVKFIAL